MTTSRKSIGYRILLVMLAMFVAVSFMPSYTFAESGNKDDITKITMNGSGTKNDPYEITTKYEFDQIRYGKSKHYVLMNNITFTEKDFAEGGDFYNNGKGWKRITKFSGGLDGNNHTIEGIKINHIYGIFDECTGATIKNLTLRNVNTTGGFFARTFVDSVLKNCIVKDSYKTSPGGGLVESGVDSEFIDCVNYACIYNTSEAGLSGGIAGDETYCQFTRCINYGNITSKYAGGGIVGGTSNSDGCIIKDCGNYGNITVEAGTLLYASSFAGGIVGVVLGADTTIKNCFNNGTITGKTHSYSLTAKAGGITGENSAAIIECFNSGKVVGSATEEEMVANAGGLSGVCASTIINSFNTGEVVSAYRAGGITGFLKGENSRISKSYNSGDVTAVEVVSGVAAKRGDGSTISNTYYLSDTVSPKGASLKKTGTPLSKANMKKKSSFKNFDFKNKWTISSTKSFKYPTLRKMVYKPQVKVTSMKVNFSTRTMQKNSTFRLSAVFTPSNTTNKLVKWSSSNPKVVKVDQTGKIKALKAGIATITCKSRVGNKTATCKVYVVDKLVKVTKINIVKSKLTLKKGKTHTLAMKVSPTNASEKHFIWKTSNKSIATVTSKGVVKGVKAGKVTITCMAADGSGKKDTCTVTVT